MIRLYFDEDSMRRSLVRALRARGVDVITALDAGMIERDDAERQQRGRGAEGLGGEPPCSPAPLLLCRVSLCASSIIRSGSRCVVSSS